MTASFSSYYASHIGLIREGNEDSALVSPTLIAVADGMGGHAGGEVASSIAIKRLLQLTEIFAAGSLDADSREDLYLNSLFDIDAEIVQTTEARSELSGMGTTLTSLFINQNSLQLLHVGDSRCYIWNSKKKMLEQLSVDHTVMQELIDQGRLTPAEAMDHPQRSLLTQALVGDSGIDPVLQVLPVKSGDKFLLCSDGLSGVLADSEMNKIISNADDESVVSELLAATLKQGAPDNVTIVWATIGERNDGVTELLGAAHE